jgi:hypothetical protein
MSPEEQLRPPHWELHGDSRHGQLRDKAKELAELMCRLCPPSEELTQAMSDLEQASFMANAAIASHS